MRAPLVRQAARWLLLPVLALASGAESQNLYGEPTAADPEDSELRGRTGRANWTNWRCRRRKS